MAPEEEPISSDPQYRKRRTSRDPESDRDYRARGKPDQERRRRKTHRATDSQGELLLPRSGDHSSRDRSSRNYESSREPRSRRASRSGGASSGQQLSVDGLAQLNNQNGKRGFKDTNYDADYLKEVRDNEGRMEKERRKAERREKRERRRADQEIRDAEERAAAAHAEDERVREEEREIRREQRRMARRAEKERLRLIEIEEAEAEKRERSRGAEREKQRTLRREREREKRRLEDEEPYRDQTPEHTPHRSSRKTRDRDDDEYLSTPVRKTPRKTANREADYASSPVPETPIKEPRKSRWWWSKTSYQEIEYEESPRTKDFDRVHSPKKKSRVVSGPLLEAGSRDEVYEYRKEKTYDSSSQTTSTVLWKKKRNRRIFLYVVVFVILLVIIIAIAVVVSKKKKKSDSSGSGSSSGTSSGSLTSNLNGLSSSEVPETYRGTYYDPWSWYDTVDFNVTFTSETVGGLPVIGLNSTWDDNVQANPNTPNLLKSFSYGTQPIRGMNIGGWLSIEPFITPSLFNTYGSGEGIIDEWTLTKKLGTSAKSTLERHYSSFIRRQAFSDIRAAGFDHVRISFSYWAIKTYDGDPYVSMVSWRYLLRGIEYARQNGLRVNLDMHGLPGSQNGWNHSGRQGVIGWLNGTDGALNAQRSLDIHDSLSKFFAQDRYKNLVTLYGLVNEPRMVVLNTNDVLTWIEKATSIIQSNKYTGIIVFGDGFRGLDKWQGELSGTSNLLLDVHQYVVFNNAQLNYDHSQKLNFACAGWTAQTKRSQNTATGFGPTLVGEWSQADTDCVPYLNNVNVGSRWTGTLNTGNASTQVLTPQCYLNSTSCSCSSANAAASKYSATYKNWLLNFALGQMESFEYGWGWFYWTWKTENAVQWSWLLGAQAGILPKTVYERNWSCNQTIPNYSGQGLSEAY